MLSVAFFMLSVIMLNVIMLSIVAQLVYPNCTWGQYGTSFIYKIQL